MIVALVLNIEATLHLQSWHLRAAEHAARLLRVISTLVVSIEFRFSHITASNILRLFYIFYIYYIFIYSIYQDFFLTVLTERAAMYLGTLADIEANALAAILTVRRTGCCGLEIKQWLSPEFKVLTYVDNLEPW